jgi:DNA-binding HxlR family transcriptional regulator
MDVIGDRWALLVVRELLYGPKRFAQLRRGLQDVSPNVLSQRLRDLEEAGVVRRDVLDPPLAVTVYELTDRGRDLRPVLLALGGWGRHEPVATSNELSVNGLLFALETVFDPSAAVDATFAVGVEGEWWRLTVDHGAMVIVRARTEEPTVRFETDVATLRAVAFGREPYTAAEHDGRLTVEGDRDVAGRFASMFS